MKFSSTKCVTIVAALALVSSTCSHVLAQDTSSNEGGDIAFGGPGLETGKFMELRDITFDARGHLYALDGARLDPTTKERAGNIRVQKFDASGKFLVAFSLADPSIKEQDPQRIAALEDGTVFVTQSEAGAVQVFAPNGKLQRTVPLPNAIAVTAYRNLIAVVP